MDMQVNPFIMLDGQAAEAIALYERVLGAETVFRQSYGEGPEGAAGQPLSEEDKKRVAHSVLKVGTTELFVADSAPGHPYDRGNVVNLCVTVGDTDTAGRVFQALSQGGRVIRPLEPIYFSPAYGIVEDKFGITIQIATKRNQA